jgi:uncharacterized RDD family membrane protein YckC
MHLECPRCRRRVDYSGERPSFCGYCGSALEGSASPTPATAAQDRPRANPSTVDYDPQAPTIVPESAAIVPEPMAEQTEVIGGYRLLRQLGTGGMGKVYEAEEIATGRRVALKLIAREYSHSHDAVERFRREGRLASRITHPRCVFVLAADEEAGQPFIVMELMPGTTLKDLVDQRGPLPIHEALLKILDVIEGLQETHRLGVIHRDVKPSNCFLEASGRVKVGDFGLSRSLLVDSTLTQTGAFLGTPLYSSPEQIRKDLLDQQTDVYSVAATLYFLLTGQAPFQKSGDAAAILARVVCDPPPPARTLRPEIPKGLDRVLLRGLERQRERRWRSLDELREALLPFVPGHLSIGGMGVRLGAYLIDYFALSVLTLPFSFALFLLTGIDPATDALSGVRPPVVLLSLVLWVGYFGLPEARWGCSVGKWLLRLHVTTTGGERPSLSRSVLRTLVFFLLLHSGLLADCLWSVLAYPQPYSHAEVARHFGLTALIINVLPLLGFAAGTGLVVLPMRNCNGYRGLHEFVTGTQVVRLPWPHRRRSYSSRELEAGLLGPPEMPLKVGAFATRGAVRWDGEDQVLVGEDAALGRRVWLWLRPRHCPEVTAARRDTGRAGRLRWLARGQEAAFQWDAFMASDGCPLPEVIRHEGRLPWTEARPVLDQLTEELVAAQQEHTLPTILTLSQVWIQPNGGVQLLDFPLNGDAEQPDVKNQPPRYPVPVPARATQTVTGVRGFLQQAACLMLQGRITVPPEPIQAPLPRHATQVLGGLQQPRPADTIDDFRTELLATRDRPPEVTRTRRAAHLALLFLFLYVGLFTLFVIDWSTDLAVQMAARFEIPATEKALVALDRGLARDFLFAATVSNPLTRLVGTAQLAEDLELRERLSNHLSQTREEWRARRRARTWYARQFADLLDRNAEAQQAAMAQIQDQKRERPWVEADFRAKAQELADADLPLRKGEFFFSGVEVLILLSWPTVWVVWAFVTRGGLSFWMLGLSLVRSDGRPALRLQCAWRALLVWLPVTGGLLLSAWCNATYWWRWSEATESPGLLWISWLTYWAAVGMVLADAGLCIWLPGRSLHDRLAGTYLVPQ